MNKEYSNTQKIKYNLKTMTNLNTKKRFLLHKQKKSSQNANF